MSGNQSIYPKPLRRRRSVHTSLGNVADSKLTVQLNKDSFIEEHLLFIKYSEAFSTPPVSFKSNEVGRLIKSLKLNVAGIQKGVWVNVDGISAEIQAKLRENRALPTVVLGNPTTANFGIEIHYENDEARRDFQTMLRGDKATQITLDIVFGSATESALLTDGSAVSSAAPTFDVEIISVDCDPVNFLDPADPKEMTMLPIFDKVASKVHYLDQYPSTAAGAGSKMVDIQTGNTTRSIMLIAETAADVLSDAVIESISWLIGGQEIQTMDFATLREFTKAELGIDIAGVAVIDFGSDEFGWLNLVGIGQAQLKITYAAAGDVRVVHDYTV